MPLYPSRLPTIYSKTDKRRLLSRLFTVLAGRLKSAREAHVPESEDVALLRIEIVRGKARPQKCLGPTERGPILDEEAGNKKSFDRGHFLVLAVQRYPPWPDNQSVNTILAVYSEQPQSGGATEALAKSSQPTASQWPPGSDVN
ncbi:hypothetical protein KM043_016738 [Ampulex compressa]|nr:hypothetical protein KM043_016738 [Ampulex compressa]